MPMFPLLILCEESTEYSRKVVGALSIPLDTFYSLEDWLTRFRIDNKLFGEIKWTKIQEAGKYSDCYLQIVKKVLSYNKVRFHSNSYTGNQYKASYMLVQSISWKLKNRNLLGATGVIFDEKNGAEIDRTRKLLEADRTFYHGLMFCVEGNSNIFNTLQVTDVLCGAMAYKIYKQANKRGGTQDKDNFVKKIERLDSNYPMEQSLGTLWPYFSKKIQNYDLS